MPQIILGPQQHAPKIEGSVRGKAYNFLEKLAENDALPGLHIEPLTKAADPRVRTGRVDSFWRAVMFKVQGRGRGRGRGRTPSTSTSVSGRTTRPMHSG